MGCLGAESGCRSESRAHPSPGTRPVGRSKLNLHTRVHCGCSAWTWAPRALPPPGKCFPSGSSWSSLSLAKALAHTQAFLAQWGSQTLAARALGSSPRFTAGVPEVQGGGHRPVQHTRTRTRTRTEHSGHFLSSHHTQEITEFGLREGEGLSH